MQDKPHCWKCDRELALDPSEPVGRSATCDGCLADVRTCRACGFYDRNASNECYEPMGERVVDKERANFCGYFRLRLGRSGASNTAEDEAKRKLAALFGD